MPLLVKVRLFLTVSKLMEQIEVQVVGYAEVVGVATDED